MTTRDDIVALKRIIERMTESERALFKEWILAQEELERYKPVERVGSDDR